MENGKGLFHKPRSRFTSLEKILDSENAIETPEDALMEWITAYQTNSLNSKEKRQFEKALMGNMELMRYVKDKAAEFDGNIDPPKINTWKDSFFWLLLLVLFLIVVIGYFYLN